MKPRQKVEIALAPWGKEDEVRSVQWRVRERKAVEAGKPTAEAWRIKGKFKLVDYQTWLLRQKGGFLRSFSCTEILETIFGRSGNDSARDSTALLSENR